MRMEEWRPDMVAFARDAAEYTGYYDRLADEVRAVVGGGEALCDAGCGLGYLGVALAGSFGQVDAVDRAPRAAAFARMLADARGARNVRVRQGDAFAPVAPGPDAPGPAYDCMVFCTCCAPARAVEAGLSLCRGTVVVINRVDDFAALAAASGSAGVSPRPELARRVTDEGAATTEGALRVLGVRFASRTLELEFGQPFETIAGARRWFALYRNRDYPHGASDAQILAHLEPGRGRWRYYLPKRRRLSLLAFKVADVARAVAADPVRAGSLLGLSCGAGAPAGATTVAEKPAPAVVGAPTEATASAGAPALAHRTTPTPAPIPAPASARVCCTEGGR